ncbi:hypothetical protein DY000_02005557 [Brassica cretica]|uniref:Uncharacterized protein n=1 Tax=Brassica cretica TaxID=69181 RepID=A0ABQ7C988_BRACR|nr:hypothetical protein DY000_02005557 [Brassica cretica]
MLQFICDAEHGIPSSCPCGGRTVDEVSINPTDKDFLPGRRSNLQKYGLHSRQPWVIGVQEEVRSLRQKVDEMAAEIAQLKELLTRK